MSFDNLLSIKNLQHGDLNNCFRHLLRKLLFMVFVSGDGAMALSKSRMSMNRSGSTTPFILKRMTHVAAFLGVWGRGLGKI